MHTCGLVIAVVISSKVPASIRLKVSQRRDILQCILKSKPMNKLKALTLIALLSAVGVLDSCNNHEDLSRTGILMSRGWSPTKVEVTLNGTTTDETDQYLRACDKDDVLTFKSASVFEESPGADDCNGDDETYTGTWVLIENDAKISMTTSGHTEVYNVVTLDKNSFVIEGNEFTYDWDNDGDDDTVKIRFSFNSK
jgi:hypothetical protein